MEETKKLYFKAAQKSGKSLHKWLDDVVRNAAKQIRRCLRRFYKARTYF